MRKDFDREYIEKELTKIDKDVDGKIDFYMLGGGARSFRGLKAATKDYHHHYLNYGRIIFSLSKEFEFEFLLDLTKFFADNTLDYYMEIFITT